jgi:DNA-directed RNA polymerase subunit RPC12/RpoP
MANVGRQVSEDGLWEWDGSKWQQAGEVTVRCGLCSNETRVTSKKADYKCPQGHRQAFISCKNCLKTFQLPADKLDSVNLCPYCGIPSMWAKRSSAWNFATDALRYGTAGGVDESRQVLTDFVLGLATGTTIAPGTLCSIEFTSQRINVAASYGQVDAIPYEQVMALQVTGATTLGTDGALQSGTRSMLMPTVVQLATRKQTQAETTLRILTNTSEYVLASQTMDSAHASRLLEGAQERIRIARAAAPPPVMSPPVVTASASSAPPSVADELVKLAQLRDSGVLSDAEFASAKARLLGNS